MFEQLKKMVAGKYANWMGGSRELKTYKLLGKCHLLLLPEGTVYPEELGAIPQRSPLPEG